MAERGAPEHEEQRLHLPSLDATAPPPNGPFLRALTATRYVILLAVASVLLIASAVFLVGALLTVFALWRAATVLFTGEIEGHAAVLSVLNLVIVMLEAVVFYIVGIGLYNLFICPVEFARRLGLDSLEHLESRIVSVIVVMIAVTFLDHLVTGHNSADILVYAVAVALVVPPLVWFKQQLH